MRILAVFGYRNASFIFRNLGLKITPKIRNYQLVSLLLPFLITNKIIMRKLLFLFLLSLGTAMYAQDAPKFCQLNDENTRFAEMQADSGKKIITMITYIECKPQRKGAASAFTVISKYDLSFFRKKEVIGRLYVNDTLFTGYLNVLANPDSSLKMFKLQFKEGNCERAAAIPNPFLANKQTPAPAATPQNAPATDKPKAMPPNKPNPSAYNGQKQKVQKVISYFA